MVKAIGQGRFAVGSHSETGTVYLVDLVAVSCDCPHWLNRLEKFEVGDDQRLCKHCKEARAFSIQEAAEKAKRIADDAIAEVFFRYEKARPDLAAVVLAEIEHRQEQVEREAEYRRIFS